VKNALQNLSPNNLTKSWSMNFSQNNQSKSFPFDEINNDIDAITKDGIK
jgi:hypothetical protein